MREEFRGKIYPQIDLTKNQTDVKWTKSWKKCCEKTTTKITWRVGWGGGTVKASKKKNPHGFGLLKYFTLLKKKI